MGYQTILLKDDGVRKTFSMFKMGNEIFSNCAKLSSALVPSIKNDHSLKGTEIKKKGQYLGRDTYSSAASP